jgi:hypothetical protein
MCVLNVLKTILKVGLDLIIKLFITFDTFN